MRLLNQQKVHIPDCCRELISKLTEDTDLYRKALGISDQAFSFMREENMDEGTVEWQTAHSGGRDHIATEQEYDAKQLKANAPHDYHGKFSVHAGSLCKHDLPKLEAWVYLHYAAYYRRIAECFQDYTTKYIDAPKINKEKEIFNMNEFVPSNDIEVTEVNAVESLAQELSEKLEKPIEFERFVMSDPSVEDGAWNRLDTAMTIDMIIETNRRLAEAGINDFVMGILDWNDHDQKGKPHYDFSVKIGDVADINESGYFMVTYTSETDDIEEGKISSFVSFTRDQESIDQEASVLFWNYKAHLDTSYPEFEAEYIPQA